MIRDCSETETVRRLATEVTSHAHQQHFVLKNTTSFRAPAKFHRILRLPRKVTLPLHQIYACHEKWLSWSNLFTHETLFPMRGATGVIVQPHQILPPPRKMTLMIKPLHAWNAISNARSNKCHPPTSPNTAPATKNDCPKCKRNL